MKEFLFAGVAPFFSLAKSPPPGTDRPQRAEPREVEVHDGEGGGGGGEDEDEEADDEEDED